MPRIYKRKTEPKYSRENLNKAIRSVRSKMLPLRLASIIYGIPKNTIYGYVKKGIDESIKKGRKRLFSDKQERELGDYIIKCGDLFQEMTKSLIRKIAFRYAEVNKIQNPFDKKTRMAGLDWYYGFMKRHSNVVLIRDSEMQKEDNIKQKITRGTKDVSDVLLDVKDLHYCLFCNHEYNYPPREDWVICIQCQSWAHKTCSYHDPSSTTYKCDFCSIEL